VVAHREAQHVEIRDLLVDAGGPSLRADGWRNRTREGGEARSATRLSPRVGLVWQPTTHWSLRAAAYGAFRAPTLNELYRQFRVGDVVTAANAELRPERVWGGEAGVVLRGGSPRRAWKVEASGYVAQLDDTIINASIGVADGLLLRQRRNLGASRTSGLELDARLRTDRFDVGVAAAIIRSRIRNADAPDRIGNRLPQVPPIDTLERLDGARRLERAGRRAGHRQAVRGRRQQPRARLRRHARCQLELAAGRRAGAHVARGQSPRPSAGGRANPAAGSRPPAHGPRASGLESAGRLAVSRAI